MSVRQAKRRAQRMHGHYNVHSYRQDGNDLCRFQPVTEREFRMHRRVRVGISNNAPWRQHV